MKYSKTIQGYLLPKISETTVEGMNTMEKNCLLTVKTLRKPKRFRSAFTTEQISFLEHQFKKFPYISCEHRREIASALNLQERAIKIWFQNRRMKEKKESVNKEIDYEITQKVEGQDRLINACTLPSVNERHSYSLPVIVKPVDDKNISTMYKVNTDRESQGKSGTQVSQNLSTKHIRKSLNKKQNTHTQKQKSQIGIVARKNAPLTEKLESKIPQGQIESKLYTGKNIKKQIDHYVKCNQEQKEQTFGSKHNLAAKIGETPEDLSIKKKSNVSPLLKKQIPAKVSVPYYPVMPSVYPHPYISSGGMIWKPVSIMPVMSAGATVNNLQHLGTELRKSCSCSCHHNDQTFTVPMNMTNLYSQYMMSPP